MTARSVDKKHPFFRSVQHLIRLIQRLFGVNVEARRPVPPARGDTGDAANLKARRDMVGNVLDLDEVQLDDVMIHRRNIVSIDVDQPQSAILEQVVAAPYTRLPLWKGDSDNIIGVINAKDVLRAVHAAGGDLSKVDVEAIMAPPWFVPETTTLREQLNAFRARRTHFALVVDEYGAIRGIVTLEDILEEIVGDIADEHDAAVGSAVRVHGDGSVIVDGSLPIRDLNRETDWNLPDEEATTVAGLVLHVAEHIPAPGESFRVGDFELQVMRRLRNQITAVRISPPAIDENVE